MQEKVREKKKLFWRDDLEELIAEVEKRNPEDRQGKYTPRSRRKIEIQILNGDVPRGNWMGAGKKDGEYGVTLGRDGEFAGFIPEDQIPEALEIAKASPCAEMIRRAARDLPKLKAWYRSPGRPTRWY
jgi:hypothetical protein